MSSDWNSDDVRDFFDRLDNIDGLVAEYKDDIEPIDDYSLENLALMGDFRTRIKGDYNFLSKSLKYVSNKRTEMGKELRKLDLLVRRVNRKIAPVIDESEKRLDKIQLEISETQKNLGNVSLFEGVIKKVNDEEDIYEALNYKDGLKRTEALKGLTEKALDRIRIPRFSSFGDKVESVESAIESTYNTIKNSFLFKLRRRTKRLAMFAAAGVIGAVVLYSAVKGTQNVVSKGREIELIRKLEEKKNQVLELDKKVKEAYGKMKNMVPAPQTNQKNNTPAVAAIPPIVNKVAAHTGFTHYLYVDKDENTVSLYKKASPLERVKTWRSTDGLNQSPKTKNGEKTTPEGFYTITHMKSREEGLKYNPMWGDCVIRINYPTNEEKAAGYTGSGIVFAGTYLEERKKAITNKKDCTNGGIVMLNSDIRELYKLIKPHMERTVVIIENSARLLKW